MFKLFVSLFVLSVALGSPILDPIQPGTRIVGGRDTTIQDHPYQLALVHNYFQHCAAVMISPDWVLTVAHCIAPYNANVETVQAGSSYANKGGQTLHIHQISIHPLYNETTIDYDIALLRLITPITNSNASAVALPDENSSPIEEGAIAVITGWGDLLGDERNNTHPTILQEAEVPVVGREDCQKAYSDRVITERMFCVGILGKGGRDACDGDSGGPAVVEGVLRGLISWGVGCAEPNHPGVYTDVLALRGWIKEISGL